MTSVLNFSTLNVRAVAEVLNFKHKCELSGRRVGHVIRIYAGEL